MRAAIAIASGKGGVGKSTVSVNLAIALARQGMTVGLMDADVYGPNIPIMMGVRRVPNTADKHIVPIEAHGIKLMSMGFLVDADKPLIWRGPMLHKSLERLLSHVDWGEIDVLLLDLPPGTGDVQLTLAQAVALTGAIIVTTPQAVALGDVRKGIVAFQQLNVPIVGIIENMSYYRCPQCGHEAHIFAHGGGREAAKRYQVPFLGEIPLDIAVRQGGDSGTPLVAAEPDSPSSLAVSQIAELATERFEALWRRQQRDGLIQIEGL